MIPESFIQDLLARIDIVDLVETYVPLKKTGANYSACCPFHNEKSPSFTVSPNKQFYHCFGCGAHGSAIGFLMAYAGLGFVEAVQELAGRSGLTVPVEPRKTAPSTHGSTPVTTDVSLRELSDLMVQATQYYKAQLRASPRAIDYLKGRGLTGEIAARFGIGYAPAGWQNLRTVFGAAYASPALLSAGLVIESSKEDQEAGQSASSGRRYDRFRDRILFPIINPKGEIIGFGGRVLDQGEPKYLNSPETPLFEKGREVFGLPQARQALRDSNTAIVVEGYMDVVALAQHGIGNAVATLGTATTPTHVRKLLRQVDRVVFCFDGDTAGRKAAWRALENALETLADNKQMGFVLLPESEDPDSFVRHHGAGAFQTLVAEATPLSDFMIQTLVSRCDMTHAEGRAKLVHEIKPLLQKIPSASLRFQLLKRIAELTGFSQPELERLCELKPLARSALPRPPRQAPSLARKLLRCVLHQPQLIQRIEGHLIPQSDSAVSTALKGIAAYMRGASGEVSRQNGFYPGLREALRGSVGAELVEEMLAESLTQAEPEPEAVEAECSDILERLSELEQESSFAVLQAKARQHGLAGLTEDEKQAYVAHLQQGRNARKNKDKDAE